MWRCFPAEIYIYLPLWSCNKQLGGDTVVVRRSWGVTSISLTLSVAWELPWSWRLFARLYAALEYWSLKLLIWLKTSTWVSCLFLGSACMGTLKLERVAGLSHAPSPGSQIVCPLWKQVLHHNLFTDQLQIPRFAALSRLCKNWNKGPWSEFGLKAVFDTGWALLAWPTSSRAEQTGEEGSLSWEGEGGSQHGWEVVRTGGLGNLRGKRHSFQGSYIWGLNNMLPIIVSPERLYIQAVGQKQSPLLPSLEIFRRLNMTYLIAGVLFRSSSMLFLPQRGVVTMFWSKPEGTTISTMCFYASALQS